MPHVFLSHSSVDKEYVKTIAEKFGSKATYDDFSFEIGEKTFDQILSAINNTDLFVIFLSDTALNSEWVKKELNIALENYDLGKIKQIFPIIIDSKINYKDTRIPQWMSQGFASYNLKPIESPFVAFRKIETKLKELESNFDDLEKNDFVGHEQELLSFQEEYYKVDNGITCIIASGLEGMGRTSFISQCIYRSGEFNKHYNPIVIDFSKYIKRKAV